MKKIGKLLSIVLAITILSVLLTACGSKPAPTATPSDAQTTPQTTEQPLSGTVATNGSTSMEKVIGSLKEQFMADHKDVTVSYDATGSGTGIESVANGTCDIGLSSRKLKDEETGKGLVGTTIALDGIAIIVNADSKVKDLTVDQIAQIFTGKVTNWSDLGGDAGDIACIGRESGSGTRDGFESITKTKDTCKLSQELTSTGAVIEAVKTTKCHRLCVSLLGRGPGWHQGPLRWRRGMHRSHRP